MLEQEIKTLIDQKTHQALSAALDEMSPAARYLQINYYYDTPDLLLYNTRRTLRIRQQTGALTLELKCSKRIEEHSRVSREFSKSIAAVTKTLPAPLFPEADLPEDVTEYLLQGQLATLRQDYQINGMTVSLDHNFYLGFEDWELEIEYTDANEALLLAERLIIEPDKMISSGKYHRFIKALTGGI